MLTLRALFFLTKEERAHVNPTANGAIRKIAPIPIGNALAFQSRYPSLTERDKLYHDATIIFHNITFYAGASVAGVSDKRSPEDQGIELFPGHWVYYKHPSFGKTKCQVTCDCSDFKFTWWYFDAIEGSHAGPDKPAYVRVDGLPNGTPPRNRNKERVPGLCKHLSRMALDLSQNGLLMP